MPLSRAMLRELCWPWLKGRGEEFGSAAVSFGRATSRRGWRSGGVWQNPLLKSSGNDDSPCVPFLAACAVRTLRTNVRVLFLLSIINMGE